MDLTLSPEIQRRIEERVNSGQYQRAEDVMAAALVSLDQRERSLRFSPVEMEAIFPGLKKKLHEGLAAADQGLLSDGDAFFDELQQECSDKKTNE